MGFVDAVRELAASVGMQVPEDRGHQGGSAEQGSRLRRLSERMGEAQAFYKAALKKSERAARYLKSRGLSDEVAERFGIGYAPEGWQALQTVFVDYGSPEMLATGLVIDSENGRRHDRFRDRIIFPIINARGEVIGFGGRILDQGEPKYLNSPETPLFEKGRELFGLPQARQALRDENCAIVVEGYMDVVALAQHGVGNAVATLGTATTPTHVQKLLRQVDRVVFCFDGDAAGRKAAAKAMDNTLEALADNKTVAFAFLPEPEDPDSFIRKAGKETFTRLIAQATPLSDFLLRALSARCDLTTSEGKARLIAEAKPLLLRVSVPLLRLQLVKRLAEASDFSQIEVERLCGIRGYAPPAPPKAARHAPSLARALLRLVLQKPDLAARIPLAQLPASPERQILETIARAVTDLSFTPSYAQLREQLRGDLQERALDALAGEWMDMKLEDADVENEFQAALSRLEAVAQGEEFKRLQTQVREFGMSGLSEEEKERFRYLAHRNSKKTSA